MDYISLRKEVMDAGLLDRQYGYYLIKCIFNFGLLATGIIMLFTLPKLWFLFAIYFAFVYVQFAFLGHDIGHQQVFKSTVKNDIAGLIVGALLLGVSRGYWVNKHNAHHSRPNELDADPDIEFPMVAFSEEHARNKRGIFKLMLKYQAFFFVPLWLFEGFSIRGSSIRYLLTHKVEYQFIDWLLVAVHLVGYPLIVFAALRPVQGVLFIIIHQMLFGLYMSSVFAPNHKGMLLVEKKSKMDFLHLQITTARNVKPGPLTDFWYGGLNYQIEHHLFPTMSRNRLRETQKIVVAFCKENRISYHQTSVIQSYREILEFLHNISLVVRQPKQTINTKKSVVNSAGLS